MDALALILSPWFLGLLGLMVGSFLNVVIHRLPAMYMRGWWEFDVADFALSDKRSWRAAFGHADEPPGELAKASVAVLARVAKLSPLSLVSPRSRCPQCGHQLKAIENIPLISWLVLKGRCSNCGTRISARYPVIEALTALLFAACAVLFGASALTVVSCIAVALLIVMALIDLEYTLLPDSLTVPLIAIGLVAAAAGWTPVRWIDAATGALVGYGVLWALGAFWQVVFRKPQAMAEGDMKMLAGIGALLGWQAIPGALLLAAGVGSVIGIGLIAFGGHKREAPIPFGPYLALGGLAAIFFNAPLRSLGADLAAMIGGVNPDPGLGLTRIGLTGGIGSGKSTVARMLVERGALLVDTDAIARELTLPGGAAMPPIAREFGPAVIAPDGALDRDSMRARAFADPQALARLEAILHPLIGQVALDRAAAAVAGQFVVFDVPLLAESLHWRDRVDRVLVVDCSEATQVQRVVARPGWSEDAARRVIAKQASRERRRRIADAIVFNDGITLDRLDAEVAALLAAWRPDPSD